MTVVSLKICKNVHKHTEYFSSPLCYPSLPTLAIASNFFYLFRHILISSILFFRKPPQFVFSWTFLHTIAFLLIREFLVLNSNTKSKPPWVPHSFLGWPETTTARYMFLGLWTKSEQGRETWNQGIPRVGILQGSCLTIDDSRAAVTTPCPGYACCVLQHFLIPDFLGSFLLPAVFFLFPLTQEVYEARCDWWCHCRTSVFQSLSNIYFSFYLHFPQGTSAVPLTITYSSNWYNIRFLWIKSQNFF